MRAAPTHMNATKSSNLTYEPGNREQAERLVQRLDRVAVVLGAELLGDEYQQHQPLEDPQGNDLLPVGNIAYVRNHDLNLMSLQ